MRACMMYDTDQCTFEFIVVCVGVGGGGGAFVFPYATLCGLFWWDCALRMYRISYLG